MLKIKALEKDMTLKELAVRAINEFLEKGEKTENPHGGNHNKE